MEVSGELDSLKRKFLSSYKISGAELDSLLKGMVLIILNFQGRRNTVEGAGAEVDLGSLKGQVL